MSVCCVPGQWYVDIAYSKIYKMGTHFFKIILKLEQREASEGFDRGKKCSEVQGKDHGEIRRIFMVGAALEFHVKPCPWRWGLEGRMQRGNGQCHGRCLSSAFPSHAPGNWLLWRAQY